jgi:hypothetical protein
MKSAVAASRVSAGIEQALAEAGESWGKLLASGERATT